jgi:transcriptional regulator with XRE-family HTH domain
MLMGYAQGFISNLELSKKLPTDEFLDKLIQVLSLDVLEAEALRKSAKESQRRYVLAQDATPEQFRLIYNLWNKLDQLQPGQMRMIEEVLNFSNQSDVPTQVERGVGTHFRRKEERPM